ncbi:MAG TPA: peptidoglycan-associated lipoprotein Pal [Burkholderiales bacterium]|nr:peptidoglycan-associated lipoprotein Pal [Burkholderiales bacterium]
MKKILLSILLASLLAACASQEAKEQSKAAVEERTPTQTTAPTPQTAPAQRESVAVDPLHDPSNILSRRSVYYDFDSSSIKDEYRPLVEAHARYLSGNRSARVTVQGNCDERGSREYNLALGQRRADGVKKAMTVLGASSSQIQTVSFGKEKPKCTEHGESCWSQDRRSDIVYQGE